MRIRTSAESVDVEPANGNGHSADGAARTSPTSRKRYELYRGRLRQPDQPPDSPSGRLAHKGKPRSRSFRKLFIAFLRLLGDQKRVVIFALVTLTVATLLKLVPPAATKFAIDYVLTDNPLPDEWPAWAPTHRLTLLFWLAGGVAAMSLLTTVVSLWGRWRATKATNRVQVAVRRQAFDHALRLPLHRVYQLKSGGTASLLREDAGGIGELIFSMIYNPWRAVVQLLGSLLVLVWVDWRLLVGALFLLPIVFVTHRTWVNRIRPMYRDIRAQRQEIDSHATETFGGIRVVRVFGRQRSESGRFVRSNHLMVRQQLHVWWWTRIIEVVWDVMIPLASTGLLLYGGYRVLEGELSLGDLTMFLVYLVMLLGPLATLAESATAFQNNLAGLDRVLDLLNEPREMIPVGGTAQIVNPSQVRGHLALSNVSFRYPGSGQTVLREINLEVEPGETIALVGRSGAGKTTLCNLVARFYDPTSGSIMLDGRDLRELDVDSYRRLLSIVEQDVFLFDGSIRDNIGYAIRQASEDDVIRAAKMANAHEFIAGFEYGYDTVIGERGVRLSGGQRQRLAIARAILVNPRILILDEATSNLDSESERLIQQSLTHLMKARTCLVIAHRLSTITHADRIVVLEDGRILEIGSHSELMRRSGRYQQMVALQMGSDERLRIRN